MARTTCAVCGQEIESSGGDVYVTVSGLDYSCPVGAQHGLDHVTACEQGWVCNGDLLAPGLVERVGLTRTTYILAELRRATAYPPTSDPNTLRVTLDYVSRLVRALPAGLER